MWWERDSSDLDEAGRLPTWEMFRRLHPYVRPHLAAFLTAFALGLVGVALHLGQPLVLRHIIDVDVPGGELGGLFRSALLYLGLMVGMGLATLTSSILLGKAGVMAVNAIKRSLFAHFFRLGVLWLEKLPVGTLVSRIESDSQRLVALTSTMMMQILHAMGTLVGALVVLAQLDMRLFAVAAVVIPLMLAGTFAIFRLMRPRFRKERSLYGKLVGLLAETLPAARFLQAVGRSDWARERVAAENRRYNRFSVKLFFLEYGLFHALGFLEVVMTVVALWLGSRWVQEGTVTVGTLVAFAQLIAQIYWPIIALSEQLAEIQRAGGAADRIFQVLDTAPTVAAPPDHEPVPVPAQPALIRFEDRGLRLRGGQAGAARGELHPGRRRDGGPGRAHGRGQEHAGQSIVPLHGSHRGAESRWTATTCAISIRASCAGGSASCSRTSTCSRPAWPTTCAPSGPRWARRPSARPRARRVWTR